MEVMLSLPLFAKCKPVPFRMPNLLGIAWLPPLKHDIGELA